MGGEHIMATECCLFWFLTCLTDIAAAARSQGCTTVECRFALRGKCSTYMLTYTLRHSCRES